MNRARAKELLPIIQAFAEGKDIEFSRKGIEWASMWESTADLTFPADDYQYRIKPEPREYWINLHSRGYRNGVHDTADSAEKENDETCLETIHVREVIE